MGKIKAYNVGDKVFAKLRGYPSWPAIILENQKTKYEVQFYGTGESGVVQTKDLFYYVKHKNTLIKSLKQKQYNKAVEEIETAIQECGGSDGNPEGYEAVTSPISCNTSVNDSFEGAKSTKGKGAMSWDELNDCHVKKRSVATPTRTESAPNSVKDAKFTDESIVTINQNDNSIIITVDDSARNKSKSQRAATNEKEEIKSVTALDNQALLELPIETEEDHNKYENVAESDKIEETIENISPLSPTDVQIVTSYYLRSLIAYAEHVKKNGDIYKKKLAETRNQFGNEVVLVKLPSEKFIGIKYNRGHPPSGQNEYERAAYDSAEAKTILSIKKIFEEGKFNPEEYPNLFEANLNIDESHILQIIEDKLTERMQAKLKFYRIESSMIELSEKIKGCLGSDKAESKTLESLNLMLQLDIEPLMLKKHPNVVHMIERLRRYIGNAKKLKLTVHQYNNFLGAAKNVRDKANEVYLKFSQLFNMSHESLFWKLFTKEVEEFQQQVKGMQAVVTLRAEPNSRQAFLDSIGEAEEVELIVSKMERLINIKKENLSKAASSESNTEENPTSTS